MPNIKSAKKRVELSEIRRQKNAADKSLMKTELKKFAAAVESGDKAAAEAQLIQAVKVLDKTASKGVIHKNMAARKKSALYRTLNEM